MITIRHTLIVALLFPGLVAAQPDANLTRAEQLLAQGESEKAVAVFDEIVEREPDNARAWLGLAKARHESGDGRSALDAMGKAATLGAAAPSVAFHSARIHAGLGDLGAVRESLEDLADTGVKVWGQLKATPELAALIGEPSLQPALDRIKPCATEAHRQFHFWLGEWRVHGAAGGSPGSNTITLEQEGCVLRESFENGPYTGTSLNYYDPADEQWRQVWIDNTGLVLELEGGWNGESMVLSSDTSRITWTPHPDGTVRQVWERASDEGESWDVVFDGRYEKIGG